MHGGVDFQINRIFNESGIFRPGTSRHKEKDTARKDLADQGRAASSEALADATGLHSYTYARDCKDSWHRLGHFARHHMGLKDMTMLGADHAEQYLLRRIQDGIAYESWKKEAAHIGKLENALRELAGKHSPEDFISPGIRTAALDPELRTLAREQLARGGKEFGYFAHPEAVIARLEASAHPETALIARIQLEGGARCREACRITEKQLQGIERDPFTGQSMGQIHLTDTKGGKPRTLQWVRRCMPNWKTPLRNAACCMFRWMYTRVLCAARRERPAKLLAAHMPSVTASPVGGTKP